MCSLFIRILIGCAISTLPIRKLIIIIVVNGQRTIQSFVVESVCELEENLSMRKGMNESNSKELRFKD